MSRWDEPLTEEVRVVIGSVGGGRQNRISLEAPGLFTGGFCVALPAKFPRTLYAGNLAVSDFLGNKPSGPARAAHRKENVQYDPGRSSSCRALRRRGGRALHLSGGRRNRVLHDGDCARGPLQKRRECHSWRGYGILEDGPPRGY